MPRGAARHVGCLHDDIRSDSDPAASRPRRTRTDVHYRYMRKIRRVRLRFARALWPPSDREPTPLTIGTPCVRELQARPTPNGEEWSGCAYRASVLPGRARCVGRRSIALGLPRDLDETPES